MCYVIRAMTPLLAESEPRTMLREIVGTIIGFLPWAVGLAIGGFLYIGDMKREQASTARDVAFAMMQIAEIKQQYREDRTFLNAKLEKLDGQMTTIAATIGGVIAVQNDRADRAGTRR